MPNGMHRKQNLPNDVLKVVSSEDSWSGFTCQKSVLVSRVENNVALGIHNATSSTLPIE